MKEMILSILAILISVIAIIMVATQGSNSYSIKWEVVIGVLSILVTTLIGWQIWNVISFEDRIKETEMRIENIVNEASTKVFRRTLFYVNLEHSSVYMTLEKVDPNAAITFLAYAAQNLESLSGIEDQERKEIIAKFIHNTNNIIEDYFDNIKSNNLDFLIQELIVASNVDNRIAELLMRIERKKAEALPKQ